MNYFKHPPWLSSILTSWDGDDYLLWAWLLDYIHNIFTSLLFNKALILFGHWNCFWLWIVIIIVANGWLEAGVARLGSSDAYLGKSEQLLVKLGCFCCINRVISITINILCSISPFLPKKDCGIGWWLLWGSYELLCVNMFNCLL